MQKIAVHGGIAPRNSRLAFTLIELLVTITIIAVLAGMLLASLSRAHMAAKATACENNLRQMGLAFALYFPENNDCFPTAALKTSLGPQPEDWVWWQVQKTASGSVTMRDPAHGSSLRDLFFLLTFYKNKA
jgi:prepilin-type N-terminal cleavage/methylation domain-containing protein